MRNQQIYEEACDWFVQMRDGDDVSRLRSELMEWLRRSPEHVSAYLDIAAVWMEAKHVDVDANLDLGARIAMARADNNVAEIVPRVNQRALRFLGGRGWFALVASVMLVAIVLMAWWQFGGTTYSTGIGEQRSVALRDGSTIELNSLSRVRIHLDERERRIELLQGQALFHVAKDEKRPFIVQANDTAVRAVGTVFDVYRKNVDTIVTVVEGRVSIAPQKKIVATAADIRSGASKHNPIPILESPPGILERHGRSSDSTREHARGALLLGAGEQLVVRPETRTEPKAVNVSAATAWTRRELVFEFTPLAEAAAEFNRYNERPLIVEGEKLREFKISAVFRSTDTGSLVRYLAKMPGVRIEQGENTILIRSDSN